MGRGVPELVLELNGRTWTLDPSRSYNVGRDPQGDMVLDDARVSWRHATVRWAGRSWLIEDQGSTNGTYVQGQRIHQMEIGPGSTVHLGNATDGPRVSLSAPAAADAFGAQPAGAVQQQAAQGWQAPPAQQQPPAQQGWQAPPQGGRPPYAPPQQAQQAVPPQQARPQQERPAQQAGGAPAGGDRSPTTFHRLDTGRVMRIGRALENELVVSDLQVSRHHAEFRATPDGRFEIRDLGSHNGTYVNGQPVTKSGTKVIGQNDIIGVGHSTFRLVGDRLEEFVDTGEVSFSARHLTVTVDGGKQILKDVSFGVPEKSLIAVIGPSGSGKSTLLKALTGYRPANQGDVLYDNRNLYKQFAELRQRIGLVPQDDILHKELTVQKALKYAAKLRFPGDTAEAEREARIDEVLHELKLDVHKDKKVTSLSGGQRKRVSVALELLTKPSLIFLDEPTSGLDPGMDRDVMQLLRGLADDGRTVLVVTHSVAELALCDKLLVMAPGGGVAYFGPPEEALNFFQYDTWADVFSAFENYRDYDWMGRWRGSPHFQLYAADFDAVAPQSVNVQAPPARIQKSQSWGSQLWTLMRRYVSVLASDRGFLGLMLILPAVLGVVSMLIPSDFGLGYGPLERHRTNRDASTIMLILAVGMCFSGAANSVRELIKERVIYERERATGLSRSAYLMSKVIVLGVVTAFQGVIIAAIGFSTRNMPTEGLVVADAPAIEMALAIIALGFTSMMFGLIISALVKTAEKTMPLLVMFAIVQVVFTGVLFQLFDTVGVAQFAWLMPSRWAVAAMGATADMNTLLPWEPGNPDPLWKHQTGVYVMDMIILITLGVGLAFVVARLLRRHEPEVMRK
ncbi:FHA modulated ABC efflux pump with fused ATPase and integral membrane subunit [Streptomyces sp. 2333.5]|uniref:ABC transporter ATP-binding protein/permease n=1 Tax=unclassified Streptomyces TaxID=2593676 RepID=UPI000898FBCA|nr:MULTISPECIES: FHA domain-containing protein [unclassified Streptomyces]PJJ01161.1 FHA modulated ABC efflux pump with fused ATPase and integral membrane subunit [Streptomyces sp. 2333.5]SEC42924.1 FHA modulated ABC efflux pump with fused ATPase and integral membrane subunits [Streptomyces sp. 2314.4]SED23319.1 FHA modulated ABC efflux pump with fused ATPase and integral membrane subunits [Streptomyces sp. 2112.2]